MKKLLLFLFSFILLFGFSFADDSVNIYFNLDEFEAPVAGEYFYIYNASSLPTTIATFRASIPYDITTLSYLGTSGIFSGGFVLKNLSSIKVLPDKFYYFQPSASGKPYYGLLGFDLLNFGSLSFSNYNSFLNNGFINSSLVSSFTFSSDGHYLFMSATPSGSYQTVYKYYLSNPFDINSFTGDVIINGSVSLSNYMQFSHDGHTLFLSRGGLNYYYYSLSTAWDISSDHSIIDLSSSFGKNPLYFYNSGYSGYLVNPATKSLESYSCTTPYFPYTCSFVTGFNLLPYYNVGNSTFLDVLDLGLSGFSYDFSEWKTSFFIESDIINVKFCGDFNNDDELYLDNGIIVDGVRSGNCFLFSHLPVGNYDLILSGNILKVLYNSSGFNISDGFINGFSGFYLDGINRGYIASLDFISYGIPDMSKVYYYSVDVPGVLSDFDLGNKDIHLGGGYYNYETFDDFYLFTPGKIESGFTGTSVNIIEMTGHLEYITGNVFIPYHEQFLGFFFSGVYSYITWAVILIVVFLLVRMTKLGQRKRR